MTLGDFERVANELIKVKEENEELKEKFKAINKGLQKVVLKRKKWKHKYELARCKIKELKKQLHELGGVDEYNKYLLIQQQKFIKYLEDEIERLPGLTTWFYRNAKGKLIGHTEIVQGAYKEILQKYKEIIGVIKC